MKILSLFSLFFHFFISVSNAQEICDNGIDDNGDGLIDLNDTVACACNGIYGTTTTPPSLIPNPSFEQMTCCPSGTSQMNCATGWIQASDATSDYMNTCGWMCQAVTNAGLLPFPNGNGIVGEYILQDYKEYIGACLSQPMLAGQSYTIQMSVATTPVIGPFNLCNNGVIYYSAVDMTIYGSTNCTNLPFPGYDCPPPTWMVLGSASYTPSSNWGTISITFTPAVNIAAVIIGAPCVIPPSYNANTTGLCFQYFYFDNLILNSSNYFSLVTLNTAGLPCHNDVVLSSHADTAGGTWQWYRDGIALVGYTDSVLHVSANSLGNGLYTARFSLGPDCQLVSDSVVLRFPTVNITGHQNVSCIGGSDGSAIASASGGTGTLAFSWNTNPPQTSQGINNLSMGVYIVNVTDNIGCTASDTVTILQAAPINITNQQIICGGDNYTINNHIYNISGIYNDTLTSILGCDSIVVTQLTVNARYSMNNPQFLCVGQSYTINSHSYSQPGMYYDTLSTQFGCDSIIETQIATAPVYTVNNPQSICSGQPYHINSHSYFTSGNYTDTLTNSAGCDSIILTQLTVNSNYYVSNPQAICEGEIYIINAHSYNSTGSYSDTLNTVTGCDSVINTLLFANPLPVLNFNHPPDLCIDAPELNLTMASPPGGSYSGTGVLNNFFYPSAAAVGVHHLTYSYTDPLTNCKNRIEQDITVNPLPEVLLTINPQVSFLADNNIAFVDKTAGGAEWYWDFGDNTTSTDKHGWHHYTDTGHYQINLIVINNLGCASTSSSDVYIGLEFAFNVPNAFTPNGDGKNESFNGKGIGIKSYEMTIFNRWGEAIFRTDDLFKPWYGGDSPNDTYVYKIDLEDITGKAYEYVGHVSIVR